MAVKRCKSSIDVVKAAKIRIRNTFRNGLPVYMSFSGGKDSIVLAELVLSLIQTGEIRADLLTVQFIDEEAIFSCIEQKIKEYRMKFLAVGAKFDWYCLEVKHYNCFNMLSNDESFICWDRYKRDVWVRQPPTYAIRNHTMLRPRLDTYQDFLTKRSKNGLTITGVRAAESIQRLQSIANAFSTGKASYSTQQVLPIYDWTDNDVWKYLCDNHIDIPEIYLFLWQSGTGKRQLRVSQFFSIDTARSLVKMNEYYPDLMERIIKREPNAYLASLYWDSEMFGRSTAARKAVEGKDERDYKEILTKLFSDINGNFPNPHHNKIAIRYRNYFLTVSTFADNADFKKIYDGIIAGDPKCRTLRSLQKQIRSKYAKKEREGKV